MDRRILIKAGSSKRTREANTKRRFDTVVKHQTPTVLD